MAYEGRTCVFRNGSTTGVVTAGGVSHNNNITTREILSNIDVATHHIIIVTSLPLEYTIRNPCIGIFTGRILPITLQRRFSRGNNNKVISFTTIIVKFGLIC